MSIDEFGFEVGHVEGLDAPEKKSKRTREQVKQYFNNKAVFHTNENPHFYRRNRRVKREDTGEIFESISIAENLLNTARGEISQAVRRNCRAAGTYWSYADGGI